MRALSFLIVTLVFAPWWAAAQNAVPLFDPAYEGGPDAPIVSSAEYPDQSAWYRSTDATFRWTFPSGTTAVSAEVSNTVVAEPQKTFRPPVHELKVRANELAEGVNYVLVQFRNEQKWGMYATYRVNIDDTAPEPFTITTTPYQGEGQNGVIASFVATDGLSGIAYYAVSINGSSPIKLTTAVAQRGHFIPVLSLESQRILVRAYDQAGNVRESSTVVLPIEPPVKDPTSDPLGYIADEPAPILLSLMTGLLLLMFGYLVYERQRYASALTELREETGEIETQMFRVFAALREEIYEQIGAINRKTRLTKKEKEAVEGLSKALEVSEQLLEKEVKDVKKILK